MFLRRILAYNISLRWSSYLWATFRIHKHSAPPELKRLVAARRLRYGICVICGFKNACPRFEIYRN